MKEGAPRAAGARPAKVGRSRKSAARRRLESEATQAAARATTGRSVDAGMLSPATPSRGPGGTGRPLPGRLLDRLEAIFEADLGAVRVHTEGAAARFLSGDRARTAGSHVYLDARTGLESPALFPILAHEIAHVLQQTGVRDEGDRWVAHDVTGSGEPLAWEAPFGASTSTIDSASLIAAWLGAAIDEGDADAQTYITALQTSMNAAADRAAFWEARAAAVLAGTADSAFRPPGGTAPVYSDLPQLARAALYDALKREGKPQAAAVLLENDEEIPSYFPDPATYVAYVDRVGSEYLLDRIAELWESWFLFEEARPNKAIALTMSYLLGTFSSVPRTPIHDDANPALRVFLTRETALERQNAAIASGLLTPNELQRAAILAVADLESYRVHELEPPDDGVRVVVTQDPRLDARLTIAANLTRRAQFIRDHAAAIRAGTEPSITGTLEARHLIVRNFGATLGAVGDYARQFFMLGGLAAAARAGAMLEQATAAGLDAETLRGIGATPEPFPGLVAELVTHATNFYARGADGALPTPEQYERLIENQRRTLSAWTTQRLQAAVIERINRAWNVPGQPLAFDATRIPSDRNPLLAQAAWLLVVLGQYIEGLGSYSRTADEAYAALWGPRATAIDASLANWPADDVRIMHRARAARSLFAIATAAGLDSVVEHVRPVIQATEQWASGQQEQDVLAITEAYRPEPRGPISKLVDDMQGAPILGWEQFTAHQIATFFVGDHYRRISRRIDALLRGPEGSRFELDQVPILNQAQTTERTSPAHPLRHTIGPEGFIYLFRPPPDPNAPATTPGTPAPPSREPLRRRIEAHPLTRATVAGWDNWLVPARQASPDLVLWYLPTPVGLARFLKQIPDVNDFLARFARIDAVPPAVAPTAAQFAVMDDATWWNWWVRLTETNPAALERRRALSFKAIPEVNARLAAYAREDVLPPSPTPPTADQFATLGDDAWFDWFVRLTDVGPPERFRARNLAFRNYRAVHAALAAFAAAEAEPGSTPPSEAQFASMAADPWLRWWEHLTRVSVGRREAMRLAIGASDLDERLARERGSAWEELLRRQREALVHERERIVRVLVIPLLEAYDATSHIGDTATVNGQDVQQRDAARQAMEALQRSFLYGIPDEDERRAHQTAAVLRIALVLRDRLVERDGPGWTLRGWDRDVALWWMPILEETLERAHQSPPLDSWMRADERPSSTWKPERITALENVYDAMVEALRAHQTDFGFESVLGDNTIENPGSVHKLGSTNEFGPGHPFTIDGTTWEVVGVDAAFTYHPPVIRRDGTVILAAILKIDGVEVPFDGSRDLLRVDRDGQYLPIKNDVAGELVLRQLSHAVTMAAIVEQLLALEEGMREGITFAGGLALDVVGLIPGFGQAAEAARLVVGIGSVLADPEFRELALALIQDPAAVVAEAWTKIQENFSALGLTEAMLISPALERLESLANIRPQARSTGRSSSRIGKILRRLGAIGRGVAGALGRVIGLAHDVRDDLQSVVIEHLLLGRILDFIAEHLRFLADLPQALANLDTLPDRIRGTVRDRFVQLVETVGRLRLPEKLITLDDVVGIVLELVGRRLGGKYRIGYELVRIVLQAAGRWDEVVGMIATVIREILGDPTDYLNAWSVFVNDQIAPHLREAQTTLHGILATIYGAIPGGADPLPEPSPLNLSLAGDQFLDAAPLPRPGAVRAPLPAHVELTGGRPLAPAERTTFEGQLGQDLSHVRVHTGSEATRATRAAGARALTTGSHVVLAPDVRPEGEAGERVMRHELVHVLQQTGPRPLGASDPRPTAGSPGRGLRIDPRAEALAEEISRSAGLAEVAPMPGEGVQPDLLGVGQRFIDYLTHAERARPEVERIERTGGGTGGTLIGREVRDDVAAVGSSITTWINSFARARIATNVQSTFGPAANEIKAWLQSKATMISNAIDDLAIDSSEPIRRRDDARESPEMRLDVEGFERKLQRFITVATGCSLDIELRRTTNGRLHRQNPFSSARLVGMNLALVPNEGAGAPLWTKMMRNTFSGAARTNVHVLTHARILLFAAGFGDNVWDSAGFKLQDRLAGQIRREGEAAATIALPEAESFWYGDVANRPTNTAQPALWIGKHGDTTHHGMTDRQSHHTTQYLLVQYFEQLHTRVQPFPDLTQSPTATVFQTDLGFTLNGRKVLRVDDIKVGELDPNSSHRGSEMPAILMAAVTHRRGRLHVSPVEVRDSTEDDSVTTQAGAVRSWFELELASAIGDAPAQNYWRALDALAATPPGPLAATPPSSTVDPTTDPLGWIRANATAGSGGANLKDKIPQAMRGTYRRMREVMLPAIAPALRTLELTWYEELAKARNHTTTSGSPYHVTSNMITRVVDAARENNRTIMETQSKWA